MSFITHHENGLRWLTSSRLGRVQHGFSTRIGGVSHAPWDTLNLGISRGDEPAAVEENYRRFCAAIDTHVERVVLSKQIHETTVRAVTSADAGKGLWRKQDFVADALITHEKHIPLTVFSADCGLILLFDPLSGSIGAVHSGWRGCAGGIVKKTVEEMRRLYKVEPSNLLAAVGPCIGKCCFETDADVPKAMRDALGTDAEQYIEKTGVKWHVDLAGLNRQWLIKSGLAPENIDMADICTACHPEFFWSHRKMGEKRGVQAAMIASSGGARL